MNLKKAEQLLAQALCLNEKGKTSEAERLCRKILDVDPDHFQAWFTLGLIRFQQGKYSESMEIFRDLCRRNPRETEARLMLFSSCNEAGDAAALREISIDFRDHPRTKEELFLAYWGFLRICDWDSAEKLQQKMLDLAASGSIKNDLIPGVLLGLNSIPHLPEDLVFKIHRNWGKKIEQQCCRYSHDISRTRQEGKLKIGYLSADFCRHPVGFFIEPIISHHDRSRFEVYCYAKLRLDDQMTERIRQIADHFVDITHLSYSEAAERIHRDGIDILVELGGHTAGSALQILAYKPAPVQISYLGYPNTSGLSAIDFRISDPYTDIEGGTRYTEQLLRMPTTFLTLRPVSELPRNDSSPSEKLGRITFGSFNHIRKLNKDVIEVWSTILDRVHGSRLLLKARGLEDPSIRENIAKAFSEFGVDPERLQFAGFTESYEEHARKYNEVDIALDTFPYNGTTTTCEALWMGVPVVTLCGKSHASRVSYSILKNIGFEVTIAKSRGEYIEKAVSLAGKPQYLGMLRRCLPVLLRHSPICRPELITRELERLYRDAWEQKTAICIPSHGIRPTQYQWIFVTGSPRFGSTLCLRAIVKLLVQAGYARPEEAFADPDVFHPDLETPPSDDSPVRVMHMESLTPQAMDLLRHGKAKRIHILNDPGEEGSSFRRNTLLVKVSDLADRHRSTIRDIARFLGLEVDDETIESIADRCGGIEISSHGGASPQADSDAGFSGDLSSGRGKRLQDVLVIEMKNGVRICVPPDIHKMTPYVLLEQGDWFEDEIRFVRKYLQRGMNAVDIGANFGCYTLSMAKEVGDRGTVWAFEPCSDTATFLEKSMQENNFRNIRLIRAALSDRNGTARLLLNENSELNTLHHTGTGGATEVVAVRRLDDVMDEQRWPDIDFLKIDAEGEELRIIDGAREFLSRTSPLIMFELKHGDKINTSLVQRFLGLGFDMYKLVPGLSMLVPFDPDEAIDDLQLNLFCCRKERAAFLCKRGLLVREPAHEIPVVDQPLWREWLSHLPYAQGLLPSWKSPSAEPGWETYEAALNDYVLSRRDAAPAARYAHLKRSFLSLVQLLDIHATVPRLLSLVRVGREMGYRRAAVQILDQVCSYLTENHVFNPSEPFLCVSARWESIDPEPEYGNWCLAQVLAERERLQSFSSYFTGTASLPALDAIEELGFLDQDLLARKRLIRRRFGMSPSTASVH